MIPVTRKELYLNKIVGNDDYSVPEKPISEEELFFAEILGEAVQAPEPLTRYQMYLAKIAGRDIEIPTPITRLEYFLAKAAGMDITVPVPITREEIYWSNYTAIVEFEIENTPPLTYKAIEGTLKNYRIYGNTVNGESVGDRTGNLFDYSTVTFGYRITWADGQPSPDASAIISDYIHITPGSYRVNMAVFVACYDSSKIYIGISSASGYVKAFSNPVMSFTVNNECSFIRIFTYNHPASGTLSETIMLNSGSTALPYEPYGYRVPVTVTNGTDTETTNLYLLEQIKMVGDEAEYVDYKEQKQHRVRKNLLPMEVRSSSIPTGISVNKIGDEYNITGTNNTGSSKSIIFAYLIPLEQGTYIFNNFSSRNIVLDYYDENNNLQVFTCNSNTNIQIVITGVIQRNINVYTPVPANIEINDTILYMLRKADIEDDTYEPYIENTDLDVTLPALPTLTGTNVLSMGTAVQPSKVYVKYKGERQ